MDPAIFLHVLLMSALQTEIAEQIFTSFGVQLKTQGVMEEKLLARWLPSFLGVSENRGTPKMDGKTYSKMDDLGGTTIFGKGW